MDIEDVKYWFELSAIIFGALLAFGAIFSQTAKAIEKYLDKLEQRKNSRDTRHLLIVPEAAEIAKFCVKNRQNLRVEYEAHVVETLRKEREKKRVFWEYSESLSNRARSRLITLSLFFLVAFAIIAIKFTLLMYF